MQQLPNYPRMFELIDATFATRQDPDQLQVTPADLEKLAAIHPATLSEKSNALGPLIWVLIIPTVKRVMDRFLENEISERQILELTPIGEPYDAIYLCSATALPEARGKGETKQLCINAIESVRKDHPVKYLFTWPFTPEGARLAESVGIATGLPVLRK